MQLLNDKGHVKAMNVAVNLAPMDFIPDEVKPSVIKSCVGASISTILNTDPEIKQAFDKAACDLMLDKIVKDLDLKKDENFKPTAQDLFAKSVADALFSNMFRK